MKPFVPLLCLFAGSIQHAMSEESAATPLPPTRLDASVVVVKFVPPELIPPKEVPAMRVDSAVTGQHDGKQITVLRGEPSALPDLPRQEPPAAPTAEALAAREAFAARQPKTVVLQMSSTTFDDRISTVRWRHPQQPEKAYEAVVGLDFALFAQVTDFTHRQLPHRLLLLHSGISTAVIKRWQRPSPELPVVEPEAFRVIAGDPADAEGMAPLTALMDLYAVEKDRLSAGLAARKRYLADAAAWQKANPPPPDRVEHTFWLRPHRGSRYLQTEGGSR